MGSSQVSLKWQQNHLVKGTFYVVTWIHTLEQFCIAVVVHYHIVV